MIQARNFAVMTGVQAGLTCAMKRARGGVEDIQTRCSFFKAGNHKFYLKSFQILYLLGISSLMLESLQTFQYSFREHFVCGLAVN